MGPWKRQRAACVSGDTAPCVPLIKSAESELLLNLVLNAGISSEAVKLLQLKKYNLFHIYFYTLA